MPLVASDQVLVDARRRRQGVAAFNVIQIEHAEAVAAAAERAKSPVILQISQNAAKYHGALDPIATATLAVARLSTAPIVVHLDHATDQELVARALGLGFTSVMFDGSTLPWDDNLRITGELARRCREAGVWLEAELGEVGGKDGVHAPGVRTDPAEAADFVATTGVNALAVAVGSSHAMTTKDAALDFERIADIAGAVSVPLVLHGSSGVPEADLVRAVHTGLTKINIGTHLNVVLTDALRTYLDAHPDVVDPRKYWGSAREVLGTEVERLVRLIRGAPATAPAAS